MNDERRKIFEELLEEFASYRVDIDGWIYKMGFMTKIYDEATGKCTREIGKDKKQEGSQDVVLEIKNLPLFLTTLNEYVDEKQEFLKNHASLYVYDDIYLDGNPSSQEKQIMTTVFSNASPQDFKNPISFLKRQIEFLKNGSLFGGKVEIPLEEPFDGKTLVYGLNPQHSKMETPYSFQCEIRNEDQEVYHLPTVSFGIADGTCFIYAIQDFEKHDRKDKFYKQIKRTLYQANKGVIEDENLEKITSVSPSAVCSLSLFFGFMHQNNIQEYEVVPYLPMRYQSKSIIIGEKIEKLNQLLASSSPAIQETLKEEMDAFYQAQDQLQMNITNKFVRNFLRMNYHLNTMEITAYPNEVDDFLHFTLQDVPQREDETFVEKLYHQIGKEQTKKI